MYFGPRVGAPCHPDIFPDGLWAQLQQLVELRWDEEAMKEPKAGSEAEKNWMIWVNIFFKRVVSTTN